ncbi:MAG: glycosyltransferase family 2 protein [Kiritimatiellae bacterium]|nr:glycosyltransferase family 2 protein [Kiritimatiellia bacterium]
MSTATFIIPVYNGEKLIAKTIDSILSQTVLPEQIIIVDDCSTDRTIFILEEYKKQHPKLITIIKHKENLGRSMACNSALDIVKTDYCLMIDADDIAEPNRLEKQVQFMDQNKDVCASSSFVKYINSKGDIFGKGKLDVLTREIYTEYMRTNEIIGLYSPASIVRMSMLNESNLRFRPQFKQAQDIDLWNRISEKYVVIAQPEFLTRYRIHSGSVTTTKFFRSQFYLKYIKNCIVRRRNNKKELSLEEFETLEKNRPILIKIKDYRKVLSKKLFHDIGYLIAEKKYIQTIIFIFFAFVIRPKFFLHKIKSKI